MLINKKFLALALLPLFGACVVNDADDDAAGTDTDVSTTNTTTSPTTTSPTTTDPSTTEPTSTTDPATTDPGTESVTDTEADTSATDTDTTDTDTGGDGGYCGFSCEAPEDCCSDADPNCIPGLGTYPYAWTCEENICTFGGCTEDDQCTFGGVLVGYICDEDSGFCGFECAEDAECQAQIGMETFVCNGTYCEAGPCVDDAACGEGGTCDVATGECDYAGCTGDKECMEGQVCVLP